MGEAMKQHRSSRNSWRPLATFLLATALCWTAGVRAASAAPIKVACIGEHTTHSHAFPAANREAQPAGNQEYPAQLQTMLGQGYEVRNFGDCCATVLQGYTVAETHPYVAGSNGGDGVGYKESLTFLPDIVIIGSWGRHDWGLAKAPGQMFTLAGFQQGYDDLVQRYQALSSKPKIFVSYPIPILNGQGDVADNGVTTSSVKPIIDAIAKKYNLTIIDLYKPFLNMKTLFKQPPDGEGEGEHVTNEGLTIIANTVFAVMKQQAALEDAGIVSDASSGMMDASTGAGGAPDAATVGSGGSGGSGGAGTAGQGTAGDQAGSSAMPQTGGSSAAGASATAPASSDSSGCSCSFATQDSSVSRTAALLLGGLALFVRRRQRASVR
jgi:acyl-CoA thioesterase I